MLAPHVPLPTMSGYVPTEHRYVSAVQNGLNPMGSAATAAVGLIHVHGSKKSKTTTDLAVSGPNTTARVSKKRRRTNKELEMFDRHVKMVERRQKFTNQWIPIPCEQGPDQTIISSDSASFYSLTTDPVIQIINNTTPTPNVPLTPSPYSLSDTSQTSFRQVGCQPGTIQRVTPINMRENPLPSFPWAESRDVWQIMLEKEELPMYARDTRLFARHPALTPRMRTILLDWIMEVSEAFKLKRDTYHMCVDVIDRFLSHSVNLPKAKLQLTGVAALFIASKVETKYIVQTLAMVCNRLLMLTAKRDTELYSQESQPLKVGEISYVTDMNCSEKDILQQEILILKALNWSLSPLTVISWVTTFLQTISADCKEGKEQFMIPQYSQHPFIQIMRLLDLCLLDAGSLQFSYSILSATAIYYMSAKDRALSVSGYQWSDIAECVEWMDSFALTLKYAGPVDLKFFNRVSPSETHNIQTHVVSVSSLSRADLGQTSGGSDLGEKMIPVDVLRVCLTQSN